MKKAKITKHQQVPYRFVSPIVRLEEELGRKLSHELSHKVMVYGTLRKGGGNDYLLAQSKLLAKDVIVKGYAMYGHHGFPYSIKTENPDNQIVAEIYHINDFTLANLDSLEGYPRHYVRNAVNEDHPDVFIYTPLDTNVAKRLPLIESGDWIKHASAQYKHIDDDWVQYLPYRR